MKKLIANYDNYDVLMGSSMNPEGMYVSSHLIHASPLGLPANLTVVARHVLIDFREDGITPFATIWKHGLVEEKV